MSVPRSSVGVGVLGRRLYAVGGYDGSSRRCLSSVECYNPLTNQWSAIADMNHRRSGPAVADLAARIYAVGGHDGLLVRSSVEYFDPRVGVWCSVVDMHHARRNAGKQFCLLFRFILTLLSISRTCITQRDALCGGRRRRIRKPGHR